MFRVINYLKNALKILSVWAEPSEDQENLPLPMAEASEEDEKDKKKRRKKK